MPQHLKNTAPHKKNQAVRPGQAPAAAGCPRERSDLPCLYSNNTPEKVGSTSEDPHKLEQILALTGILPPYHRKAAQTLYSNVSRLISLSESVGHIGFLTLTFPDNVTDAKDAYKRFDSFNSHYLKPFPHFKEWISVKERQRRGAWHYHLLIQTSQDIRTGIDFDQLAAGNYQTANASLRQLWTSLRDNLPKYGLGRSELLPIRTNAEGMGRYLGKYISKHLGQRTEQDKGIRLVNSSRGWAKNSVRFSWNTENAKEWRRKVALFAKLSHCEDTSALSQKWGKNWAYNCLDMIINIDELHRTLVQDSEKLPF